VASGGQPLISNNDFTENKVGLYLSSSLATVDSNNFKSNSAAAIYSAGHLANLTNNSGSANNLNGIAMQGSLTSNGSSATLKQNPLPYVIKTYSASVANNSDLTIEKGVVVKSDSPLNVDGNLFINGENPEDIVFTSLADDSISGDTTNDATTTSPSPGQFPGIYVFSTGSLKAKGFTMRYAGSNSYGGNNSAAVMTEAGILDISNALFSSNYPYGIYAVNSQNIKIENARFENHNYNGPWGQKAAMVLFNSNVILSNVSFSDNVLGILSDLVSVFSASAVEFINNIATTSPSGLW
jgi:type II secretory pathway pseudopilin PulG